MKNGKKILVLGVLLAGMSVTQVLADRDAEYREATRVAFASNSVVLPATHILVGGAENVATEVALSGAATIDTNGVLTTAAAQVFNELDTKTATTLLLGKATATAVTIGASDIATKVDGTATIIAVTPVDLHAVTLTLTSAHYGKIIMVTTNAANAITLPANGAPAGTWIDVMTGATSTDACVPTISAATADTLVGPNDQDLKSVTWATGHRIGAYAKFVSDGAFWHVLNLGGTTMTYTD
jgi:hypothetical protein